MIQNRILYNCRRFLTHNKQQIITDFVESKFSKCTKFLRMKKILVRVFFTCSPNISCVPALCKDINVIS